jgi:hypothetical protein
MEELQKTPGPNSTPSCKEKALLFGHPRYSTKGENWVNNELYNM